MRKRIITVVLCIIFFLLGAGLITFLVYKYPTETVRTITEKNVNITDTGIKEAVAKVEDSVVVVETYNKNTLTSTGSGFVFKTDKEYAYIMTNHHVIENDGTLTITFTNGTKTDASIVGSDAFADIAVLKVEKDKIISVASLGSSIDAQKGDTVFVIGSPMGIEYSGTVTKGILSGKDRLVTVSISGYTNDWIMNVMQTDAAISPGNSGGPICNANGEIIGIVSLKIVESTVEGIGFAIPIEDALNFANQLIEEGTIRRPYIGVSMINASNRYELAYEGISINKNVTEGVVLAEIQNESPSSNAGLKRGDIIVKVGDYTVKDIAEFRYRLYSHKIGDTIDLEIIRDGKSKTVKITLGSK